MLKCLQQHQFYQNNNNNIDIGASFQGKQKQIGTYILSIRRIAIIWTAESIAVFDGYFSGIKVGTFDRCVKKNITEVFEWKVYMCERGKNKKKIRIVRACKVPRK